MICLLLLTVALGTLAGSIALTVRSIRISRRTLELLEGASSELDLAMRRTGSRER